MSMFGTRSGRMESAAKFASFSSASRTSDIPVTLRVRFSTPTRTTPPAVFAKATIVLSTPSGEERSRLYSSVFPSGRRRRSIRSTALHYTRKSRSGDGFRVRGHWARGQAKPALNSFATITMLRNMPRNPLFEATCITKSYSGLCALSGVSFELREGEVHALIGENGAGKSTLIKIITGAVTADSGTLAVGGHIVPHNSPNISRALGIAAIYQQPSLFPHLTVAENIALAAESGSVWRRVDWKARASLAAELLSRIGATLPPETLVESLSMPEQQIVEIAKALGSNAKILIMDEPTASLSDREVESLFRVVALLRSQGVGIVYISHRLPEISAIADRVTVLRDGQTIATRDMRDVDRAELIRLMVGRELSAVFPKREVPIGETVLDVRGLGSRAAGVRDISFELRRGEILGLAGLVGSGRTQLAETLFGLTPADTGAGNRRPGSPHPVARGSHWPGDRLRARGPAAARRGARNAHHRQCQPGQSPGGLPGRPDFGCARVLAGPAVHRATAHQDSIAVCRSRFAFGRQSAEGGLGEVAGHPPHGVDPGRANAGRGRRVEIRDPPADVRFGGGRSGDYHDLFGVVRDSWHERPHRRHARRHDCRFSLAKRGHSAEHSVAGDGPGSQMMQRYQREISVAAAILALAAVLALAAPGFFTLQNQTDLLLTNMPALIVALGMTLVILAGQIDISAGSVFAICSVAAGEFAKLGLPTPVAAVAACAMGAAFGALNGALVAYVRIPSIVVTLAAMVALRDGLRWVTQGAWVQNLPPNFQWFGLSQSASQAVTFSCTVLLVAGMAWGLRNLRSE